MKNNFTPGPWSFSAYRIKDSAKGITGYWPYVDRPGELGFTVQSQASQERAICDARLISAAPDMFAFIESITDAAGPYKDLDGHPIVAAAYALAAKARGE